MNKIGLIVHREYTSRVFKKSFILLTLLTPILMAALVATPIWLATFKDNAQKQIVVIDKSGLYGSAFENTASYQFSFSDQSLEEHRNSKDKELTAVLYISGDLTNSEHSAALYAEKQVNVDIKAYIEQRLNRVVEMQKIESYNIPNLDNIIKESKTRLNIATIKWVEKSEGEMGEKEGSSEVALTVGMFTAILIYMFILLYGAQVMSGVIQEKTNRIVEVMICSVKPFQLMMGKIVAIAMVGLTQVLIWVVLFSLLIVGATALFTPSASELQSTLESASAISTAETTTMIAKITTIINGLDILELGICFVVFFLGGYLLYASFFAAAGSAVENETDTNQFSFPLTIPIMFALYAAIASAENPDSPLAFWCSMIPFTSPIVMMVRIPFGVPIWQLTLSIAILIASFVGSTWMAGKIYRTGILMYGKKVTWKELLKWVRY